MWGAASGPCPAPLEGPVWSWLGPWGEEGKNRAQGSPLLITLEACMGEAALRIPFAES